MTQRLRRPRPTVARVSVQRLHTAYGRRFGIGLNALGHLPQQVVTAGDVADIDPTCHPGPSWSGRFPRPLQERIHPRHEFGPSPLGPDAQPPLYVEKGAL